MVKKIWLIILNIIQSTDIDNKYFACVVRKYVEPKLQVSMVDMKTTIEKYIPVYILKAIGLYDYKQLLGDKMTAKKVCSLLIKKYNENF